MSVSHGLFWSFPAYLFCYLLSYTDIQLNLPMQSPLLSSHLY